MIEPQFEQQRKEDFIELIKHGYQITEIAGHGRFGVVYVVYSEKFKQKFSAKVVNNKKGLDAETFCLTQCTSPYIVKLYDFFTFQDKSCAILEYCQKGTVSDLIKSTGKLSSCQVIQIAYSLLKAIQTCHSKLIAHRDIKPANILIDQYCKVKLGDFGFGKIFEEKGALISERLGSTCYMAPEVFGSAPFDPFKADIWSIGMTLFVVLYGHSPWLSQSKETMIEEIKRGFVHPLKFKKGGIMDIINACLQLNPENRPTIDELLKFPVMESDEILKESSVRRPRVRSFCGNALSRVPRMICSKCSIKAPSLLMESPNVKRRGSGN